MRAGDPHVWPVIVKKWLSDPQTTAMIGLPVPMIAAPQWFYGYLVRCKGVVNGKGVYLRHDSRFFPIFNSEFNSFTLKTDEKS
jgi:hypothetical protein